MIAVQQQSRVLRPDHLPDLAGILGPLVHGRDPSWARPATGVFIKASRTPEGPGVEVITVDPAAGSVHHQAYGVGAPWLAKRIEDLLGLHDDDSGFEPPPQLRTIWRRHRGWRVPKTSLVVETLVPIVLGQKVTGVEAYASYRRLVLAHGEPVGFGPLPELRLPPEAATWRSIPSWEWHRAGVGPERSRTVVAAMGRADALERLVRRPSGEAQLAMRALPGIGEWTAAEVAQRVFGDADAISVGDFHVAKSVVHTLTGRRNGTDADMLELVEPFRPHRFRVQRLVELGRLGQPRRGPRYAGLDMRGI